jgi:hypothetical protein
MATPPSPRPDVEPTSNPPDGGETAEPEPDDGKKNRPDGVIERLRVIGGLVALGLGLVALVVIAVLVVAVGVSDNAAPIVSGAVTGISSIVAAYFGMHLGKDGAAAQVQAQNEQTTKAIAAQREEATKTQVALAHLPPQQARVVLHDLGMLPPADAQ